MNLWKNEKKETPAHDEHSENIFIDCLIAKETPIRIFLISGVRLHGKLIGSDEFSVLISSETDGDSMIYKHSIATICRDYKRESEKRK